MHNCKADRDTLIALALNPADQIQSLPAELDRCATCREEYTALRNLLRIVDQTKQSALPAENFWPGYQTRLRHRLKTESPDGAASPAAVTRISLATLLRNLFSSSVRVPIPLAAALLVFIGGSFVFALNYRRSLSASSRIIVNRTVEVPVTQEKIREKVVTRVVYRERDRRQPPSAGAIARRHKESAAETPISLVGFNPENEVKLTIIKGSYPQ
jgi:hypothetical protein